MIVNAWNNLFSTINSVAPGLLVILTIVGAAIIVWAVASYLYKKRRGGGAGGFPIALTVLGALLLGPQVVGPAVCAVLDAFLVLAVRVFEWVASSIS